MIDIHADSVNTAAVPLHFHLFSCKISSKAELLLSQRLSQMCRIGLNRWSFSKMNLMAEQ